MKRYIFVDPPSLININVPNMAIAYAATTCDSDVVDLHSAPIPAKRYLDLEAEELILSVRAYTSSSAKLVKDNYLKRFPSSKVKSLKTDIDILCSYPFVQLDEIFTLQGEFSDNFPFPKYEHFDSFNYFRCNWQTGFWGYPLLTSVGCPYGCSFCQAKKRNWKSRSASNAKEELDKVKNKYNIKSFEVLDDLFNYDTERAIEFCKLIEPLKLSWKCVNGLRADRFTDELARAMNESGCEQVAFGIESTSRERLKNISKGETIETIESAVNIAKKHIPKIGGFFIVGLPGSSYEEDSASIDWAKKNEVRPIVSYYTPLEELTKSSNNKGGVFFGQGVKPYTDSYTPDKQKKVYKKGHGLLKKHYWKEGLVFRLFFYSLIGIVKYSPKTLINHIYFIFKKLGPFLLKGSSQ